MLKRKLTVIKFYSCQGGYGVFYQWCTSKICVAKTFHAKKKASSGCHEDHSPELKDLCKANQITWLLVNTALKFRDIDCEIRLDSVSLIYKLTIPDLTIIVGL